MLMLSCTYGFAQSRSIGVRSLAVKSLATIQRLEPPSLEIPSNQVITSSANCYCNTGCAVLPVNMLSFEGRRINTALVQLDWKTTNEIDNKGFDIERSLGNSTAFRRIGFMPAQAPGGLVYEYSLPDNNDFAGTSYYRLKQIDINGQFTYSKTVAVKGYTGEASISLFPNPVADKVTADIFSTVSGKAVLVLTDATQKQLYSRSVNLTKGINLIPLPAATLGSGVYFVQVLSGDMKPLSAKLVKL